MTDIKQTSDLDGFIFNRTGNTTFYLSRGSYTSANSAKKRNSTSRLYVDMMQNGALGLDIGSPEHNASYHIYLISDIVTEEVSAIVSKEIAFSQVIVPTGYSIDRKLQTGFIWKDRWDDRNNSDGTPTYFGIPPNHVSADDMGEFHYSFAEHTPYYTALDAVDTQGVWASVDFTSFVPDNARLANLHFQTEGSGKSRIRVGSIQDDGLIVGIGSDVSALSYRVTSNHILQYKTDTGTSLTITVLGYQMTEQS